MHHAERFDHQSFHIVGNFCYETACIHANEELHHSTTRQSSSAHKSVENWRGQEEYDILKGWPGNSPDLNPNENCNVVLKQKMAKLNLSSRKDLIVKLWKIWATEIAYCSAQVKSMSSRIQPVLKAKCGHTKY